MARPLAFPDYPGVSTYTDRQGATRFRFRMKGQKEATLPDEMGSPEFVAAYQRIIDGIARQATTAQIMEHPKAKHIGVKTFRHAWLLLQDDLDWAGLKGNSQGYNRAHIEHFLQEKIGPDFDETGTWGNAPIAEIEATFLQAYYDAIYRTHPSKAKHRIVAIRKLYRVAVAALWIKPEEDRTVFLRMRPLPESDANRPWEPEYHLWFEAKYQLGTNPRTAYELAIGLGGRREDLALLGPDNILHKVEAFPDGTERHFTAIRWVARKCRKGKKGEGIYHEISDRLAIALAAVDRKPGETFLKTAFGQPFTTEGLGVGFRGWCDAVDIPKGYALHSLRHTFATDLALDGVDPLVIQKAMGHKHLSQTMHYIRRIQQEQLMKKVAEAKNGVRTVSTIKTVPQLRVVA